MTNNFPRLLTGAAALCTILILSPGPCLNTANAFSAVGSPPNPYISQNKVSDSDQDPDVTILPGAASAKDASSKATGTNINDSSSDQTRSSSVYKGSSGQTQASSADNSSSGQAQASPSDDNKSGQAQASLADDNKSGQAQASLADDNKSGQAQASPSDDNTSDPAQTGPAYKGKAVDSSLSSGKGDENRSGLKASDPESDNPDSVSASDQGTDPEQGNVSRETSAGSSGTEAGAAVSGTGSPGPTGQASATNLPTQTTLVLVKKIKRAGHLFLFREKVQKGAYLPDPTLPRALTLRAGKRWIRLDWRSPKGIRNISGYLVFRKTGSSKKYQQIAKLSRSRVSWIDKTARKKNQRYTYVLMAFKTTAQGTQISRSVTDWVCGSTTAGSYTNADSTNIGRESALSFLQIGKKSKLILSFPKRVLNKTIRWSSSDASIIAISKKGIVLAKKAGTAVIQAKTATGHIIKMKLASIKTGTAQAILSVMRSWAGFSERNARHKKIIDIYNAFGNLPVGYKVQYGDAWCDTCISAAAISSGNVGRIGRECSVNRHVKIFKEKGIWIENGAIRPRPGDLIVYSWDRYRQPNNGWPNHIGLVISVKGNKIQTLEGNYDDMVKSRIIPVGWGHIRGYARPKYRK